MERLRELASAKPDCPDVEVAINTGPLAARLAEPSEIPERIKAAGRSVRRLCYGRADAADSCITVFAIGGGRFVTNAHVLDWLDTRRDFCKERGQDDKETCHNPGGFLVSGSADKLKAVKPRILRRGKHDEQRDQQLNQPEDLAVICLDGLDQSPALDLTGSKEKGLTHNGQTAYAVGFPSLAPGGFGDFDHMSAPAISVATVTDTSDYKGIEATALVLGGMSGGPLLDAEGTLLGVARASSLELENLLDPDNEKVDAQRNIALYRDGRLRTQTVQASSFISREDLNIFIKQSPCLSCSAKCAKPL
jgi:hypothetical protein